VNRDHLLSIVPLIQQRIKLLSDAANLTSYFFQAEVEYDPLSLVQKGMDRESALAALEAARDGLAKVSQFEHQAMEELLRAAASLLGLPARQFFGTLRVAATGREASPPLFETMEVLGRKRVLERVGFAIELLTAVQH
jgi:glutamyl-tRNA synthetase